MSQLFLGWASQVVLTEKNPPADTGDTEDLIPGKTPWRRNGRPLQYSCLENPIDDCSFMGQIINMKKEQI